MTASPSNIVAHSMRPWRRSFRPLLLSALLAELLLFAALKTEAWRKTGLGWLLGALIVTAVLLLVMLAGTLRWFIAHRFQFSLRAMLLLTLVVGAGLGFLERTRKQRRDAEILSSLGATVSYADEEEPGLRTLIGRKYFQSPIALFAGDGFQGADLEHVQSLGDLQLLMATSRNIVDDDLVHLAPLAQLNTLHLVGAQVRGHGLSDVGRLPNLLSLDLARSAVTDDALTYLRFSHVRCLNLNYTRIGDRGLARLSTMPSLTQLFLDGTRITDRGLAHLARISSVEQLSLEGNKVTDAGLVYLGDLKSLRSLRLRGTRATDAGIARLKQALPQCQIVSD